MGCIQDLLNNSSFAAFLGAFSAFILVFITDSIREWRKRKALDHLLLVSLQITQDKKGAIERVLKKIKEEKKLSGDRLLEYSVDEIKTLKMVVLNNLKKDQIIAIDAICFKMTSIDEMIRETVDVLNEIRLDYSNLNDSRKDFLISTYEDIQVNLSFLNQMLKWYKANEYKKISATKYRKEDFK